MWGRIGCLSHFGFACHEWRGLANVEQCYGGTSMRTVRVLSLLGIAGYLVLTSVGCCCNPCYYRTPYYCAPASTCYQPASCYQPSSSSCATASNADHLVPTPTPMPR